MEDVTKMNYIREDTVNHPAHYEREGAIECIDEMVMVFGREVVRAFCLCNVWKYRYRAADKNGEEDIKKSDWYMKMYRQLGEEQAAIAARQNNKNG